MRTPFPILCLLSASLACAAPDFRQLINQGQGALSAADIPAAERLFRQACEDIVPDGRTPDERATCEHHLAIIDESRGDYEQAESRLLRALAEWQKAGTGYLPSCAMSLMNLGEVYRELHRSGDAEDYLFRAVNAARELQKTYPQIYPETLSRLGGVYAESGRVAQARPLLTEAALMFRGLVPPLNGEEARALDTLGGVDMVEGQSVPAQAHFSEAIRLSIAAHGMDHPETAAFQADLALAFLQNGQFDRAEPLLNRARFVIESHPSHNNLRLGAVLAGMSAVARSRNKTTLAEEYGVQALRILEAVPGQYPAATLLARVNLSAVWLAQGRAADAERILPDAVAAERRAAGETCLLADGLRTLAALRTQQHMWREARDLYREAIDIYQTRLGPESPMIVPVLREYADVLKRSGGSKAAVRAKASF